MHESGMIRGLVEKMEEVVNIQGGGKVAKVKVCIGALANISASHFREHFEIETVGTLAEGSSLEVEESQDYTHPHAASVVLESVELEVEQ